VHSLFRRGGLRGKNSLGRPRHRWQDNIKMDVQEAEFKHGLDRAGSV